VGNGRNREFFHEDFGKLKDRRRRPKFRGIVGQVSTNPGELVQIRTTRITRIMSILGRDIPKELVDQVSPRGRWGPLEPTEIVDEIVRLRKPGIQPVLARSIFAVLTHVLIGCQRLPRLLDVTNTGFQCAIGAEP
jgi:hypothetical protein